MSYITRSMTHKVLEAMQQAPVVFLNGPKQVGIDPQNIKQRDAFLYGRLVENFVATELIKQIALAPYDYHLYHYRTEDQKEIYFLIERRNGDLVGIDVKSSFVVNVSSC